MPTDPPNGTMPARIGRYVVERELGRGGMGVIYKAHDPSIDRPVAIKLVRTDLVDDPEYILRFTREAQAAARCAHPNIVSIYDFAVENGVPYLTMEFLEGITLGQAMADGRRFRIEETVTIIAQVLDGLSAAHARGIVHRDIKPANILLLERLRVKVMDFGIARPAASELTQAGAVIGSPHYMAPEQFLGQPVDHRADLFAVGVLLFHLITGERPFAGKSFAEIAYGVVNHTPDPGPRAQALPGLGEALTRALAKRAEDRWNSADAMADALRAAIATDGSGVTKVFVAPPAPSPGVPEPTLPSMTTVSTIVSPELRALTEKELARYLGPIAKVLVKRALASPTVDAFRRTLGEHIDKETDRAAFMNRTRGE